MKPSHKKLLRNSIIMGFVLLAIILFYLLKAVPDKEKRDNLGKFNLIASQDPADILSMDIQYRDENGFIHRTRLSNENGVWMVILPLYKQANQGVVKEMMDTLVNIKSETNYRGITQSQLSNFGIFRPNDIFTLRFKDGSTSAIINGNISRTENYYYTFLTSSTNEIFIVYAYKFSAAELTTSQLMEKQIFIDDIDNITRFSFRALDGNTYTLQQSEKKDVWSLISPQRLAADNYAVKKRILDFYSLHILEYLKFDRTPQDLKALGLDKPIYSITAQSGKNKMQLFVSSATNALGYFAYSPRIPGIFVLKTEDVLNSFSLSVKEFQSQDQ